VEARKARGEVNVPPPSPGRSYRQVILENVFSFINNVFYALCLLLVLLGRPLDAILPLVVVLINAGVSVFQEVRAKRKLDQIALLTRPKAMVIRDGREQTVDPGEIVRGDLLVVGPGDQVVVDGTVVGDGTMEVDESQLTGESDLVRKRAGDELFSGSFCVTGGARFEAEQVGGDSFANQITAGARAERRVLTPLQREINGMIRLTLLVAAFLMVVLTVSAVAWRDPFVELVQRLVVVVGLVPQGLLLAIVVAYALGAMRVAGQGALVQQTNAIESLSNVDTFCLDKTGTLTTNRLKLADVRPLGIGHDDLERRLSRFVASATTGNKTSEAIAEALPGEKQPAIDEVPFSSARKWSALVFDGNDASGPPSAPPTHDPEGMTSDLPDTRALRGVYVLGAPEMLRPHLLPGAEINGQVDEWAARGLRVLLFAYRPEPVPLNDGDNGVREPDALVPLGLVGITDELRPQAHETLSAFAGAGVDLKIISGDNPETVKALAVQAGFDPEAKLISGPDLDRLDDGQLDTAAVEYGVFGRITPEQKEGLVEALHAQGRYVAMTGDGVNDVLSLKKADLGIAMQSGSQATRGVADIVLTNDSFAVLPHAVTEGQRIIAGMQSVLKLFLTRTFFLALLIIAVVMVGTFPFSPRQSALLSFLTAGIPAVALAAWAHPARAKRGSSLGRIASFAVPASLAVTLIGLLLFVVYCVPVFQVARGSVTVDEINAVLKDTLPRAQTVVVSFLTVCGLLLVMFVEPPGRFWAGRDEPSGDRRPTWLAIALLIGLLAIAFVPTLSGIFDLRAVKLLDAVVIAAAAAVWVFLVRWAWRRHLLERFLGTDLDR
jgi:cation-transporting P-type ATPase E